MTNDREKKSDAAPQPRVSISSPKAIASWCAKLACTESELRRAIEIVGTRPSAVARYLKNQI